MSDEVVEEAPATDRLIEALSKETAPSQLTDSNFRARPLLFGDPGAGKTDLGIKMANTLGDRICLVYSDSNWTTILKYPEIARKVDLQAFRGLSTINTFLDARDAGIEPYCSYDVLQWDTVSTGADVTLRNLVSRRKFKDQLAQDMEARGHYRLLELYLKELCDRLTKSDLHIIYTAHLRYPTENDIKTGKTSLRPAMPEASFRVLAQHCNMIGYLHKQQSGGDRLIQLSGTETVVAKCQIPNIDERTYKVETVVKLLDDYFSKSRSNEL